MIRNFTTREEREAYAKTESSVWNNGYLDEETAHAVFAAVVDRVLKFATPAEIRKMVNKALKGAS